MTAATATITGLTEELEAANAQIAELKHALTNAEHYVELMKAAWGEHAVEELRAEVDELTIALDLWWCSQCDNEHEVGTDRLGLVEDQHLAVTALRDRLRARASLERLEAQRREEAAR